jgi:hypothetical protein
MTGMDAAIASTAVPDLGEGVSVASVVLLDRDELAAWLGFSKRFVFVGWSRSAACGEADRTLMAGSPANVSQRRISIQR